MSKSCGNYEEWVVFIRLFSLPLIRYGKCYIYTGLLKLGGLVLYSNGFIYGRPLQSMLVHF